MGWNLGLRCQQAFGGLMPPTEEQTARQTFTAKERRVSSRGIPINKASLSTLRACFGR